MHKDVGWGAYSIPCLFMVHPVFLSMHAAVCKWSWARVQAVSEICIDMAVDSLDWSCCGFFVFICKGLTDIIMSSAVNDWFMCLWIVSSALRTKLLCLWNLCHRLWRIDWYDCAFSVIDCERQIDVIVNSLLSTVLRKKCVCGFVVIERCERNACIVWWACWSAGCPPVGTALQNGTL